MEQRLELRCKELIEEHEYEKCERVLCEAMMNYPHSPVIHNLFGILLEKQQNHVLAMKHFRAAYALEPSYLPARYNMDQYGSMERYFQPAYVQEDCKEGFAI